MQNRVAALLGWDGPSQVATTVVCSSIESRKLRSLWGVDRGVDRDVHDPGLRTIRPQLSVDKAGVHLLVDFSC